MVNTAILKLIPIKQFPVKIWLMAWQFPTVRMVGLNEIQAVTKVIPARIKNAIIFFKMGHLLRKGILCFALANKINLISLDKT